LPLLVLAGLAAFLLVRMRASSGVADMQLAPNFALSEFLVSSRFPWLVQPPSPAELANLRRGAQLLQRVRDEIGVPMRITSGLRSAALVEALDGSASLRGHRGGNAADIIAGAWPNNRLQHVLWDMHRAGELPELDQAIVYSDTNHVHLGWGQPPRGEFLLAARDAGGARIYSPWSP
jgi:hypothetical protein